MISRKRPVLTAEHRIALCIGVASLFPVFDAIAFNFPVFVPVLTWIAGILFLGVLIVTALYRDATPEPRRFPYRPEQDEQSSGVETGTDTNAGHFPHF